MRIILSTAATETDAKKIAEILVGERLAACTNIIPKITSIYRWKGEIERGTEALLVIKTSEEKVPLALAKISELHEYENPEAIVIPVEGGLREYLEWIEDST